ncbi:MAG TPA: M48 family metallopeptidase [Rectinemataceae bacterium]|nr:M48 family metallopeptidase [Rectinemataceae bacterium]
MEYRVDKGENLYFLLKILFTVVVLVLAVLGLASVLRGNEVAAISTLAVFIVYLLLIWLFIVFQKIYLVAHMKGNGVAISERQFPQVHEAYREMAARLGLKKVPRLFLLQEGGMLNAFAVRLSGRNYIAIYSEIFSLVATDMEAVKFVLGHELGHVRRNHMSKRFWTFPSSIIPFLTAAYSRRCEFTCDAIGKSLAPANRLNGLLVLAAGPHLYGQLNPESYIEDANESYTIGVKFMQLFMSHPYLPKRIRNLREPQ